MSDPDRRLSLAVIGLQHLHPRLYMPLFRATPGLEPVAVVETDNNVFEYSGETLPAR